MGIKGIKLLNDKCTFGNNCVSDLSFCDHYVLDKYYRTTFSTSVHKTKGMLEYVHSDLKICISYLLLITTLGKCGFIF